VDLSGLLTGSDDLDYVAERRDDEHLDGFGENRATDDTAWFQFVRVHFDSHLPLVSGSYHSDGGKEGYKQSGNGREYGKWALDEFLEIKGVVGYEAT